MIRRHKKPLWAWIGITGLFGFVGGIVKMVVDRPHPYSYWKIGAFDDFENGFWPIAGISLLAILVGKMGRLIAQDQSLEKTVEPATENSNAESPSINTRRFQFTLFRLLLAVTVFALVFGLSRMYFGSVPSVYYYSSGVIAAALGGIFLFAKLSEFSRIAMSVLLSGFGIMIGLALKPFTYAPSNRFYEPLDDLFILIPSVSFCWVVGCLLSRWDERIHKKKK